MKEIMRKFAHELHPMEFESMSAVPFKELLAEAYKHSVYGSKNDDVIIANRDEILGSGGVESAIMQSLCNDGEFVDRKNGRVYVMHLASVQEKMANRIWLNSHVLDVIRSDINSVADSLSKRAESELNAKDTIISGDEIKLPCRTCKKYMEDRTDIGGKVWCKLWDTPIENVIHLNSQEKYDGHCVPTKFATQGQPDSGTNQWGNETPSDLSIRSEASARKEDGGNRPMDNVLHDAINLSSGTMATLTGHEDFETIEIIQQEFVQFIKDSGDANYSSWRDAWEDFKDAEIE